MPDIDPNTAWSPEELAEVSDAKMADLRNIQASLPVIEEVIAWYDEQIALYKDPEIIEGANPSSKAEDIKNSVLLAQGFIKGYKYKRNEFAKRFEEYIQTVEDEG